MGVNNRYSDIGFSGDRLVDEASVRSAVDNILGYRVGDRFFNRGFGSVIEDYLFMPLSFVNSRLVLSSIVYSISRWDDRIEVRDISVDIDYDNRIYKLELGIYILDIGLDIDISRDLLVRG